MVTLMQVKKVGTILAGVILLGTYGCSLLPGDGRNDGDHGGGNPEEGYPGYFERTVQVVTNMVRMAPREYLTKYYSHDGDINSFLLTGNYPTVGPLYWRLELNKAARYHALDMAENHFFGHASSNGDSMNTRIQSFFPGISSWGENIAAGQPNPFSVVDTWLCDWVPEYEACALDFSPYDGHRANIMMSPFKMIGNGYIYLSSSDYLRYWVQDFAGDNPSVTPPTVSGTHLPWSSEAAFFLNFHDESGQGPQSISVVIDGVTEVLTLDTGAEGAGTYAAFVDPPSSADCLWYYFEVVTADGRPWRYPAQGQFGTAGLGNCDTNYTEQ